MTSNHPSSSAQQAFAKPQPLPVPAASQAASPPTKQSLKSWWKGFRPPTKSADTNNGERAPTSPTTEELESIPSIIPNLHIADTIFESQKKRSSTLVPINEEEDENAVIKRSRLPFGLTCMFSESKMDDVVSTTEDAVLVIEHVSRPSVVWMRRLGLRVKPKTEREAVLSRCMGYDPERHIDFFFPTREHEERNLPSNCMEGRTSRLGFSSTSSEQQNSSKRRWSFDLGRTSTARQGEDVTEVERTTLVHRPSDGASRELKRTISFMKRIVNLTEKAGTQPTGIFGVPLRQSIAYANVAISLVDGEGKSYIYGYVPIVVAKCGVYLKEKATNVEGIFRLSGSEKRIKELKNIFDSPDRYGKGLDWAGYTVHDAANVLRRYLNQLPEPIVPLDLYSRFREPLRGHTLQAVGDNDASFQFSDDFKLGQAIVTYQQLITELPPLNRQLLLYILDLLAVFASKAEENRMNAMNLAAIFQPGMLSHPQHDMAPEEYRLSQDVLIFLIENQDHFLIGMRGTAADEQTVQEVQNGGTPPPGTPSTPNSRSKGGVPSRTLSNSSAAADDVRKYGGIRRNVSVSSRNSRQSNGAPSPASPAYNTSLGQNSSGGVHRSNTVPSKKSPGLPSNRLQKNSGSPSPTASGLSSNMNRTAPRGLSPSTPTERNAPLSSPGVAPSAISSSLAPSMHAASAVASQERLLSNPSDKPVEPAGTPSRSVSNLFQRSPTADSERRQPNKLRKKRIPEGSNPSAQSSTHSLNATRSSSVSPALYPARTPQDRIELPPLDNSTPTNPALFNTQATPPLTETPRAEQPPQFSQSRLEETQHSSENTLKPLTSPVSSLHSHSSFNDQSDLDHVDESSTGPEVARKKRSRWSRSRNMEDSQLLGAMLSPKKGLGSDNGAGASSSSVGSSRPRKSYSGDTVPVSSDPVLTSTQPQSSNEVGPNAAGEEKKSPFGWFKSKIREKREEKEAGKERNKSPSSSDRPANISSSALATRRKSMDVKREEHLERVVEKDPTLGEAPQPPQ